MRRSTAAMVAGGVVFGAALAGTRVGPRPDRPGTAVWYASLRKPPYTPPGPVIGAVWTVLEGLLSVAGYRLLTAAPTPNRNRAVAAWALSVSGIAGWSWTFFDRKNIDASLAVLAAMLASSLALVGSASRVDRAAAAASAPLTLWLCLAGLLNEEIWRRNPSRR